MGKSPIKLNITNNIKELRALNGIAQEELANAIDVTRATISSIEKGKYNPSLELAYKIAIYFNKDIQKIFKLENTHEKN